MESHLPSACHRKIRPQHVPSTPQDTPAATSPQTTVTKVSNGTDTRMSFNEQSVMGVIVDNTTGKQKETGGAKSCGLTSFLSKLLEERHHQESGDEQESSSTTTVTLIPDNARAHPFQLHLVRSDSQTENSLPPQQQKVLTNNALDVGHCSSVHMEEKKQEDELVNASQVLSKQEAREEESSATTNVRALRRPCRWSSEESLSNRMLPKSSPTKIDYVPTVPRRKNSRDTFPDFLFEDSNSVSCQGRRRSPNFSSNDSSTTLMKNIFEVMTLLELEDHTTVGDGHPTDQ
ncbi:hypothetical protein IV203_026047 [Nitzschia inconspicua]|uniref:Uncharacterized protein n=1 Tax=Nitzschia inconspicua TaxID=303405 RepID=A0A9K3LID9_9STRA|nr:hypothetical protein IV203_009448 [Nitzschia inconspicua]KAG7362687.1 hypothetical protein IV203_026047 [Nitzschia inconspicua]